MYKLFLCSPKIFWKVCHFTYNSARYYNTRQ